MAEDYDNNYKDTASGSDVDDHDVEIVANETKEIFKNFVYRRLTSEIEKEASEGELDVPCLEPAVLNSLVEPNNDQSKKERDKSATDQEVINFVGLTLASYGDEMQARYHDTFSQMITNLNLSELGNERAYESFRKIAGRLFESGITWGRILALLCFGYEIAVTVIKQGVRGTAKFLKSVIKLIVDFIVNEKIAKWIAKQGGWVSIYSDLMVPVLLLVTSCSQITHCVIFHVLDNKISLGKVVLN